MEVTYAGRHLQQLCDSDSELRRRHGAVRARKVKQRLQQLRVADNLADVRSMAGRCHLLTGNYQGCLALDLDGPYRLIFAPLEWVEDEFGALDWTAVQAVVITEITDYH